MIETTSNKSMPIWLSALIILLCLGGEAWLVRWYIAEPPARMRSPVDPSLAASARNRAPTRIDPRVRSQRVDPPADAVTAEGNDAWSVRSSNATMRIFIRDNQTLYRFGYNQTTYATSEQIAMNMLIRDVVTKPEIATKINATPEQVEKLRAQTSAIGIKMDEADKQKLIGLWGAYIQASGAAKNDVSRMLVATLTQVADKSLPATRAAVEERANLIKSVLTPEQLKLAQQP